LLVACASVALLIRGSEALSCYSCSCSGGSCYQTTFTIGTTTNVVVPNGCGLPFNATGNTGTIPFNGVPKVDCPKPGVCFTQVTFGGSTDTVTRGCSLAQPRDGCASNEKSTYDPSSQTWSCTATCTTDLCNTGSDGETIKPAALAVLLAATLPLLFSRKSI